MGRMTQSRHHKPPPPPADAAPEPVDTNLDDVFSLLERSKAAHREYQRIQRLPSPDYVRCEQAIAEALRLRLAAVALDPQRESSEWAADERAWPHQALLTFYALYPTIP